MKLIDRIKDRSWAALIVLGAVSFTATAAFAAPVQKLGDDQSATINGVHVACAGIGQEDRADPRWSRYNTKVEVANQQGNYLGDETVKIAGPNGKNVAVSCEGPWVLMNLPG